MTSTAPHDAPGVVTLPPLIYGAFLLFGLALENFFPVPFLPGWIRYVVGATLIVSSIAVVVPSIRLFRKAGTHLNVHKPTTAIVTTGPFRYSRNPMYLAMTMLYLGIGIAADGLWILGLIFPVLAIMHFGVITREERYLERKFGEEYLTYKRTVRRWI